MEPGGCVLSTAAIFRDAYSSTGAISRQTYRTPPIIDGLGAGVGASWRGLTRRNAFFSGEQFEADFLQISPNGKIPAIVDHEPSDGGAPISIFESGAILLYLADKAGKLIPTDQRGRLEAHQWLFWQVGGLGPMAGQQNHFRRAAPEQVPYAIERYTSETNRLYGVLDRRLADRPFLAGESYSVADIATYPWAAAYNILNQNIDDFPHVERWLDAIASRPATQRAYARAKEMNPNAPQSPAPRESALSAATGA